MVVVVAVAATSVAAAVDGVVFQQLRATEQAAVVLDISTHLAQHHWRNNEVLVAFFRTLRTH